jgi:hypothetical protein
MTVFKGGRVNPINPLLNKWSINEAQTANRLQPIRQLKQSVGVGHPFVTKIITKGTQSAAQNTGNWPSTGHGNLYPDGKSCRNNKSPSELCGSCYDGISFCGGPCLYATVPPCDDIVI